MLLPSIVESLDAELARLERLREIVAALGTPKAHLVSSASSATSVSPAKVAAPLAEPENAVVEDVQSASLPLRVEEKPVPTPKSKRKARRTAVAAAEPIAELPARQEAGVQEMPEGSFEFSDGADLQAESSLVARLAASSSKPVRSKVLVQVASPPKPSMVVVSATEAARERASRAARQPVKRSQGDHHAAKPDAKPEDLARDLASRWLSGNGSAAELRGR